MSNLATRARAAGPTNYAAPDPQPDRAVEEVVQEDVGYYCLPPSAPPDTERLLLEAEQHAHDLRL